ncbi:MAG: type IV pilus assembly protein PilM [Patescibacteria group bacterium]|nr:type IV pilus assembly protein PilM [Patescibacteria group bacterium]
MFNFLKGSLAKSAKESIGVDIGTSAIKIVHLKLTGGKPVLKNFVIARLKEGSIQTSNQIIAGKQVSKILTLALQKGEIESRDVSFSIPAFSSLVSFLVIPQIPEDKIAEKLETEAKKYIPVPLSEVSLGWNIIDEDQKIKSVGMRAKDKKGEMKILLMAVSKDTIAKYETIARNSQLNLGSIEVESFALIRCLVGDSKEATIILDIGSRVCNTLIVADGFLRGARNIDIGGGSISETISRGMNIDFIRADNLKRERGMEDPQLLNLITPTIDRIIHEVKRTLDIYNQKNSNKKVKKVILIGGTSKLKGFETYLQEKLNLEIIEGNPWAQIDFKEDDRSILENFKNELAVAIGTAMKG